MTDPTLHEELWRMEVPFIFIAVVYRISPSMGRLVIYQTEKRTILPVPLSPDSPTHEDDQEWYTIVQNYTEGEPKTAPVPGSTPPGDPIDEN